MISNAQPTPRSPGQMTAVMRAAARPTEARVLRAALVRDGKVIDERILPRGAPLTVGPSEKSTFVVPALAASVRLFEHVEGRWRLRVAPGATGRVANGAGVSELGKPGSAITLGDDARGKIAIGDAVILFQIVDPPVAPPRAQLPIAVKQGLFDALDWKTTFIAAFSFLLHFGAVGALYSDWADETVDDEGRVSQTIQILKDIPSPPVEVRPTENDAPSKPTDAPAPAPKAAPGRNVAPGPVARGAPGGGERVGESRARDISKQLAAMDDAMVVAIGGHNNAAIGRVLAAGDAPLGMLDKVAAAPGGVRPGDLAGLNLHGDGGGAVRPGAGGRGGLPGEGDTRAGTQAGDVGKSAEVKKPVASANVQPPQVTGTVPDAPRVVAGLRGPLRTCYKHELDVDPTARGTVRVTASIAPNGEVKGVQAGGGGLSSTMIACVTRVVRSAQFSPPEGGGATLVIPMSFLPQNP